MEPVCPKKGEKKKENLNKFGSTKKKPKAKTKPKKQKEKMDLSGFQQTLKIPLPPPLLQSILVQQKQFHGSAC